MNDENALRIAALEQKVAALEALLTKEVARLDKRITDDEEGTCYYIEKHGVEQRELADKVWLSFSKTHPEYFNTLNRCEEILGKPKDDGSDPQP